MSKFVCLGIETSCDETAAAVVVRQMTNRECGMRNKKIKFRKSASRILHSASRIQLQQALNQPVILSSVVCSQINLHKIYGGVVPEIAGRAHIESILPVIHQALKKSGKKLTDLDAIAVTNAPGLVGALLIGVSAAKALSLALDIPLIGVNHLEAHLYAWQLGKCGMGNGEWGIPQSAIRNQHSAFPIPHSVYPAIGLIASGGHTSIYLVKSPIKYVRIGQTTDDAAGEAFDKVAHILGLGYPGGPAIEKAARRGNPETIKFPRPEIHRAIPHSASPIPQFGFSFSGLKTAVLYYAKGQNASRRTPLKKGISIPDIAASFQETVAQTLADKVMEAVQQLSVIGNRLSVISRKRHFGITDHWSPITGYRIRSIILGGGVVCNKILRQKFTEAARQNGLNLLIPPPELCTDNAAMTAGLGAELYSRLRRDRRSGKTNNLYLDAHSQVG